MPLFKQICSALAHVHARGVLHRDVKPSNVLIARDKDGRDLVKLVDFGLAKLLDQDDFARRLTATGDVKGSPLYMSPEQCQAKEMTPASDMYSFGCLMYETVTGVPAFNGENALHTMYMHTNVKAPPMSQPDVVVSKELQEIIFKCLEKDPRRRYQTAKDLLIDLAKFEAGTYRCSLMPRRFIRSFFPSAKNALLLLLVAVCTTFAARLLQPRQAVEQLSAGDKYVKEHISRWGNAQQIDLAGQPLTTVGMKCLEHLPRVRSLNLAHTNINDDALEVLSHMPNLEVLNISETAIDDAGLSKLHLLHSLRELTARGCHVTDKGISALASLPYLTVLDAENCWLEVDRLVLPRELQILTIGSQKTYIKWGETARNNLANLAHLRKLYVNGELVPEPVVEAICHSPELWYVSFKESILRDCSGFASSNSIRVLDFESAKITPDLLGKLPQNLQSIVLKNTGLRDADLVELDKLVGLRWLDLSYNSLTDECIRHFLTAKKLEHLNLSATNISPQGIVQLSNLTHLKELLLYDTRVDDQSLATLGQLRQLELLDLVSTQITTKGLAYLAPLPKLAHLELIGTHLNSADLATIADFSHLQYLTLDNEALFSANGSVNSTAIDNLQRLKSLTDLDVAGLKPAQRAKISPVLHCHVRSAK